MGAGQPLISNILNYLLKVKNISTSEEAISIGEFDFGVTGNQLIEYSASTAVAPDPQLEAELFSGGEAEGWASYLIGQGEGNLILLIDEILNFEEGRIRYLALDEGAAFTVPADLLEIQPTDLGANRSSPAHLAKPLSLRIGR